MKGKNQLTRKNLFKYDLRHLGYSERFLFHFMCSEEINIVAKLVNLKVNEISLKIS